MRRLKYYFCEFIEDLSRLFDPTTPIVSSDAGPVNDPHLGRNTFLETKMINNALRSILFSSAVMFGVSCSHVDTSQANLATVSAAVDIAKTHAAYIAADAALEDIALARRALEEIHPGYDHYISAHRLDQMWDEIIAQAKEGITEDELYLGLVRIIAEIRCEHTKIELSKKRVAARDVDAVYLPFRFRVFDGRMFIDAPGQTGLSRGTEIVSIDGVPASARLRDVAALISVDGYTDYVRWETVEASTEELGSGFDHYDPILRPDDTYVTVTAKRLDGQESQHTFERLTYPEFRAITGEARRRNFSDPDAVTVRYVDDKTAYLSINTFVNYRTPVDPMAVFDVHFRELKARGIERLILDNRDNGGGSTDVKNGLLAHLMDTSFRGSDSILVKTIDVSAFQPHLDTWEPMALDPPADAFIQQETGGYAIKPALMPELQTINVSPNRFEGELILLTSHANASGATQMTGLLKSRPNTRLIGEPTGGTQRGPNGGVIYFLTLPNSEFVIRIPWQFWRSTVANPVHGQGYAPDIGVTEEFATWLAGDDAVLKAALQEADDAF